MRVRVLLDVRNPLKKFTRIKKPGEDSVEIDMKGWDQFVTFCVD